MTTCDNYKTYHIIRQKYLTLYEIFNKNQTQLGFSLESSTTN